MRRVRGGVLRGAARRAEGPDVDDAEDLLREKVALEVVHEAARALVAGRGDGTEDGLDLAQAVLDGLDIALRRAALVAGS